MGLWIDREGERFGGAVCLSVSESRGHQASRTSGSSRCATPPAAPRAASGDEGVEVGGLERAVLLVVGEGITARSEASSSFRSPETRTSITRGARPSNALCSSCEHGFGRPRPIRCLTGNDRLRSRCTRHVRDPSAGKHSTVLALKD